MNKIYIRIFLIILLIVIIFLLLAKIFLYKNSRKQEYNNVNKVSGEISKNIINNSDLIEKEKINQLNFSILYNREGELVFSFSIDDFINSYNSFYFKDKKNAYLTPVTQWSNMVYDKAIHSNYETYCYYFIKDENKPAIPTLAVYIPSNNENYVQEITINFDDHSYTDEMYKIYEEICFYTLKVLFNDLSNEQIIELYEKVNKLGYDKFPNKSKYINGAIPYVLYYRNGVGVYPYFAMGESLRLCIIPITEKTIKEFEEKGVIIHEI